MIESFRGVLPTVGADVFVAPSAWIIGDVELKDRSSVWHGAVVRGDVWRIRVGELSNIQDLCVCHVTTGGPELLIGRGVTVGHRAVLHSCVIEENCLIGMGAVILDGARVGRGSIVAAGSVLLPGAVVPPDSLVAGVPAAVKRRLEAPEIEQLSRSAVEYHALALSYLRRPEAAPPGRPR